MMQSEEAMGTVSKYLTRRSVTLPSLCCSVILNKSPCSVWARKKKRSCPRVRRRRQRQAAGGAGESRAHPLLVGGMADDEGLLLVPE